MGSFFFPSCPKAVGLTLENETHTWKGKWQPQSTKLAAVLSRHIVFIKHACASDLLEALGYITEQGQFASCS